MSELPFKFDEIGIWSELKLEIIEQYGAAYTTAFTGNPKLKKYYIDAFSGAGQHVAGYSTFYSPRNSGQFWWHRPSLSGVSPRILLGSKRC